MKEGKPEQNNIDGVKPYSAIRRKHEESMAKGEKI